MVRKGPLASEGRLPTAVHPLGVQKSLQVFPILTLQGAGRSPGVQVLSQRPSRLAEELGFQLAESANSTTQHDCCKTAWPSYSCPHPGPLRTWFLRPHAQAGWPDLVSPSTRSLPHPPRGPPAASFLGPWLGQAGHPGPGAQGESPPPPLPNTHTCSPPPACRPLHNNIHWGICCLEAAGIYLRPQASACPKLPYPGPGHSSPQPQPTVRPSN